MTPAQARAMRKHKILDSRDILKCCTIVVVTHKTVQPSVLGNFNCSEVNFPIHQNQMKNVRFSVFQNENKIVRTLNREYVHRTEQKVRSISLNLLNILWILTLNKCMEHYTESSTAAQLNLCIFAHLHICIFASLR